MWIELDKRQCFNDILDGKIDLDKDDVRIVGFQDEGWVEPLNIVELETVSFLLECDDVKLFKNVVDKE